ncbi:MAG TPA: AraC family transcriptional regulator [Chthoniobacterales bacterium]
MNDFPGELWTPTSTTDLKLRDLRVMHGGPVPMHLPEHVHAETQVEVHFHPLPGSAKRQQADHPPALAPAQSVIIAPTQPHVGRWEQGSEVIVLLVSADALGRAAEELLVRDRFEILSATLAQAPLLQQLAVEIRRELGSPFGVSRFYLESIGHLLFGHLLRQHSTRSPWRTENDGAIRRKGFRRADAVIDEHLETGVTVELLARELEMQPQRLTRWFKATTGYTPYQYVSRRRLEQAMRLLSNRRLGLAEIALRLGFASQSHFTAVFRRATALTPSAYRRAL